MSHFAMNILSSSVASANACIIRWRAWPSWLIAPPGAVFVVESFTDGNVVPSRNRREKDRSRIDLKAFDLCGIAAIGETFICCGGLSLILSHSTIIACPVATFSRASSLKCSSASANSAETCGPLSTASHICCFVQSLPVCVGHPYFEYSNKVDAAGCSRASPVGHIEFR